MKRWFYGLVAGLLLVVMAAPVMAAPQFIADEDGNTRISARVNDDAYVAGGTIVVEDDIQGDLVITGGMVEVEGDVAGDLMIVGGTIQIYGDVGDDVRIGGGQVTIYGTVADDVMIGGGTVVVAEDALVRGSLLVGAGKFSLHGNVQGDLKATFTEGRVTGRIDGDAELRYGGTNSQLSFGDDAKVGGTFTYYAPREMEEFEDIADEVIYHKWTVDKGWPVALGVGAGLSAAMLGTLVLRYLGLLVLGGLLVWLVPKYLPRAVATIKKSYWTALWQGLVFLVLVPIAAGVAAVTVIGLPLAGVLVAAFFISILLARVVAGALIGSYIIKMNETHRGKQFGLFAAGVAIYALLAAIPVVGWIVELIFFLLGMGGLVKSSFEMVKSGKY